MKISSSGSAVESSGVQKSGNFTIKATGKAFAILSSGLYTNKILAIVRELSCNAYDAHVAGGNVDEPFTVKLPNRLDPSFAIRDYGIGLSDEQMMTLYTTYFESTKGDSNDFIGALGLGSKSPYSYTSSFTVESFFHGVRRVYTAYIGEDGLPAITLMTTEATDERNGLRVSFPVNIGDIHSFAREAENVYRYFKVIPIITGNVIAVNAVSYSVGSSDDWGYRADASGGCRAIMGNVAYPITTEGLKLDPYQTSDKSQKLRAAKALRILTSGFDLRFNIGDCDVTASREALSYDENTIKAITDRAVEAFDSIVRNANSEVDAIDNEWDAVAHLDRMNSDRTGFKKVIRTMNDTITEFGSPDDLVILNQWRGVKLDGFTFRIPHSLFAGGCNIRTIESKTNRFGAFKDFVLVRGFDSKIASSLEGAIRIRPANTLEVYVNDQGRAGLARIRKSFTSTRSRMESNQAAIIITFEPELEPAMKNRISPDPVEFKKDVDAIVAAMKYDATKVVYASTIVLPKAVEDEVAKALAPKVRKVRQPVGGDGLFVFRPYRSSSGGLVKMDSWLAVDDPAQQEEFLNNGGYFVYLDAYVPHMTATKNGREVVMTDPICIAQLQSLKNLMVKLNLISDTDKIYGVRRSFMKHLNGKSKNLSVAGKAIQKIADAKLIDVIARNHVNGLESAIALVRDARSTYNILTEPLIEKMFRKNRDIPQVGQFYEQLQEYKKMTVRVKKAETSLNLKETTLASGLYAASSILGVKTDATERIKDWSKKVNSITEKLVEISEAFPLMMVPINKMSGTVAKHVVEYVKMVGTPANKIVQVS